MNFTDLKNKLGVENGQLMSQVVSISSGTLTSNIDELLIYCYDGQPFVVNNAQFVSEDDSTSTVVIKGTSNFLDVKGLSVTITFTVDTARQVQIAAKYSVIGDTLVATNWSFAYSFPNLPKVTDNSQAITFNRTTQTYEADEVVPIDELDFFHSYFIVTSQKMLETEFNVTLEWGINFAGYLRPKGFLGVIENLFKSTGQLTVSGTIRKPLPTEKPETLESQFLSSPQQFAFPWTITDKFPKGLPGILLQVSLGLEYDITSSINFNAKTLFIYTPISTDWILYNTNPRFIPIAAYTGSMGVTSGGSESFHVDMVSPITYGMDEFTLIGMFQGASLSNFAQLAGFTGSSDSPLSQLPDVIQKAGSALAKLELMSASISVDYSDLTDITISDASFTIGIPDLNWVIWGDQAGQTNHLEVVSIGTTFDISYPFSTSTDFNERELTVTVFGSLAIEEIPFNIYASNKDGFTIFAELDGEHTIPLHTILNKYAPGIPAPSDLTINNFKVSVTPGESYSMGLMMANQPNPFIIPLGPKNLIVENVCLGFTYENGSASGNVSGIITIEDFARLDIAYSTPGNNIAIRSYIPTTSLNSILGALTNQSVALPDNFNLTFTNNSVLLQKQGNDYTFQLATQVEGFGLLALQVQKVNTEWGVAFGLDMTGGLPSSLSGLGFLSSFESMFKMNKFLLVVSSFKNPSFNFPDTAAFNNPILGSKTITLPGQAASLVDGLNIYAEWTIDTSDKGQNLLMKFLGVNPILGITLQVSKVPSESSKLFVSYDTTIMKMPFSCKFGGSIVNNVLGLFLEGTMKVTIQGHEQTFTFKALFVLNGAFISGTMDGDTAIEFSIFKISNLALEIGINFEGIPSLGIAATIDVTTFESSIAVFFDSVTPSKSLVAGSVSDLHLGDVLETFTQGAIPSDIDEVLNTVAIKGTHEFSIDATLADDLNNLTLTNVAAQCLAKGGLAIPTSQSQFLLVVNTKGSLWYFTDMTKMRHYAFKLSGNSITVSTEAQFYCAPECTNIGNLPMFPQGFYINGAIEFLGFSASMTVDISKNKGIAVDAQMDAIVIGNENLFSIKAAEGTGGPIVSISTFSDPTNPVKEFQSPHFYINGAIKILGMTKSAFVNISTSGASFDIKGDIVPVLVSGELNGSFSSITDMNIGGSLRVGIKDIDLGPLGNFKIGTGAKCTVDFHVKSSDIGAKLGVKFELGGDTLDVGTISIDIATKTFEDLPEILFNAIKDFLEDLFKDPKKWAKYAASALGWAQDQIESALSSIFPGLSKEDINTILNVLFPICALTQALVSL